MFEKIGIKQVASYWDARPCNIRHSPKAIGTREYFDEVEKRKYFVEPHIPRFAQFSFWGGRKVLEIGCGIGTDTINFARAGAAVTAVDISEESLKIARQRARAMGVEDNITFYQANAEELSDVVPAEPYDLAYSFGMVHHTPHPGKVMEQIRRYYVKPSTIVKIMVYNKISTKAAGILLSEGFAGLLNPAKAIASHSEAQTGCPVTYTYTRQSVRNLFDGFQILNIAVEHIFPYRVEDYQEYRYIWKWYYRILPKAFFRLLEKNFGWHLCVTAIVPE